jgi:ABC-type uncharacterized transport system permease subunit
MTGDTADAELPIQGELPEAAGIEPGQAPNLEPPREPAGNRVIREIMSGNAALSFLAIVLGLLVASVLIALTDPGVQAASGYLFARPGDTFVAIGTAISGAYYSLFQGAIYNFARPGFQNGIRPLTETLTFATPLIAAGLGVALAFRVGLFNIGGRGQIIIGAAVAGWISWSFPMPFFVHMLVATIGAIVGGAVWGGLVGLLNYVAFYLVAFLLRTPGALQANGSNNPISPPADATAAYPTLTQLITALGGPPTAFRVHFGFILVILATIFVWYLLNRSSLGFRFRAVGQNPHAAKVAGINVKTVYIVAMVISGGLVGLAGAAQVLGTTTTGFSSGVDAGIGFDAITVALLGRSKPWGVFFAGILFGALKAGGYLMQASQSIPIDIILVVQSVVVLFIAAPPLVRSVFHLPPPGLVARPARRAGRSAEAATK